MNILLQSVNFLNSRVLDKVAKKHKRLFSFGFLALSLQSFTSLNSNARTVCFNRQTAESKIFRLVRKEKIKGYFPKIAASLELVKQSDIVNIDFSSFCGFEVLTFAKQTVLGRALPLFFGVLKYPIESEGSQTIFIIERIKEFKKIFGFYPRFVFDRGFTLPLLVKFLLKEKIIFYIRMKKDKYVFYQGEYGKCLPLKCLPWFEKDCGIVVYNQKLRMVISETRGVEPWYILTNDWSSEKDLVISRYYFRFEIEETFKDLKHVVNLKKFFIKKSLTFSILLWFCILPFWLSFLLGEMKKYLKRRLETHCNKRLSTVKYFLEAISQAKNILFREAFAV